MYKTYSLFTGMIVSIMILSNALLVKAVGNFTGTLLIHCIGLSFAVLLFLVTKTKFKSLKGIPLIYLLGGATGYLTVYFANVSFLNLGATVTLMLSMFGQITTSTIIDHYGFLGMNKYPFRKSKLIGLALMLGGVALIVFF